MRFEALHHVSICCSDYARSKAFYVETLGLRVLTETHRKERDSWKLDLEAADGRQIELCSFPNPPMRVSDPEACGLRHVAFEVRDLEACIAELSAKGVACEPIRIDSVTGVRMTFFRDPDGLPLELRERTF